MTIGQLILIITCVIILINQVLYYIKRDNSFGDITLDSSNWAIVTYILWILIWGSIIIGTLTLIVYMWDTSL